MSPPGDRGSQGSLYVIGFASAIVPGTQTMMLRPVLGVAGFLLAWVLHRPLGKLLGSRGLRYLERTLPDLSAADIEDVMQAGERAGRWFGKDGSLTKALHAGGVALGEKGHYADALRHHERALEICRGLGHRRGEAVALAHIGLTHSYAGRLGEGLRQLEFALPLIREAGDRMDEAILLRHIGCVHEQADHPDEALKHLEDSLAIFRELGDDKQAVTTLQDIQRVQDDAADLD